jgi:hypothetical protein
MKRTRSSRARANTNCTGELRLGTGGKARVLFVTNGDPTKPFVPNNTIDEWINDIADNSEDVMRPCIRQHIQQTIGYASSHGKNL